jgi:hypothetical protein
MTEFQGIQINKLTQLLELTEYNKTYIKQRAECVCVCVCVCVCACVLSN